MMETMKTLDTLALRRMYQRTRIQNRADALASPDVVARAERDAEGAGAKTRRQKRHARRRSRRRRRSFHTRARVSVVSVVSVVCRWCRWCRWWCRWWCRRWRRRWSLASAVSVGSGFLRNAHAENKARVSARATRGGGDSRRRRRARARTVLGARRRASARAEWRRGTVGTVRGDVRTGGQVRSEADSIGSSRVQRKDARASEPEPRSGENVSNASVSRGWRDPCVARKSVKGSQGGGEGVSRTLGPPRDDDVPRPPSGVPREDGDDGRRGGAGVVEG